MLRRIRNGEGTPADLDRLKSVADRIEGRTICALGDAAAWPVQELVHPWLNKALDAPNLLSDGRSPSVLNGGLGDGPIPLALAFTAIMAGLLDVRAIDIKERTGYDKWIPGDYGFDPLNIVKGASPVAFDSWDPIHKTYDPALDNVREPTNAYFENVNV